MRGADSRTQGIHLRNGAIYNSQNQIQIMDHQVQNNRYIRAARLIGGNACGLYIKWPGDALGNGVVLGRIAQQMPYLTYQPAFLRQRHQKIGLFQRGSYRFFHQHMLASPQGLHRQFKMEFRRRGHHYGIARSQQRIHILHNGASGFLRHQGGTLAVGVKQPHQRFPRNVAHFQGMKTSEMSGSNYANLKCFSHEIRLLFVPYKTACRRSTPAAECKPPPTTGSLAAN